MFLIGYFCRCYYHFDWTVTLCFHERGRCFLFVKFYIGLQLHRFWQKTYFPIFTSNSIGDCDCKSSKQACFQLLSEEIKNISNNVWWCPDGYIYSESKLSIASLTLSTSHVNVVQLTNKKYYWVVWLTFVKWTGIN